MSLTFSFTALIALSPTAFASLEDVSTILARGRGASFEVSTQSNQDPIRVEANGKTRKGQTVNSTAQTTPEDFVSAVRAKVPSRVIRSGENSYLLEWEKISAVGDTGVALYDILGEIKDHQYDPKDFENEKPMGGYYSQTSKILSIVGPLVSVKMGGSDYFPGAAHPNHWDIFRTYDSRKLDKTSLQFDSANLLDVVDEVSFVAALKKDRVLSKLIPARSKRSFQAAKSVKELEEILGFGNLENCYSFPLYEGKVPAFAIYSYDSNSDEVSVRVALSAAAHVCQAEAPLLQLGLKLKPTSEYRKLLQAQVSRRDGLFMSQVSK